MGEAAASPMPNLEGPFPPCGYCGSGGWPADLEVEVRGRATFLCIDCWGLMPEALRMVMDVTRDDALRLREVVGSCSWRGWGQVGSDHAGLVLPSPGASTLTITAI